MEKTLKSKMSKAHILALKVKSLAIHIDYYCEQDDTEGKRLTNELLTSSNELINLLKNGD